MITNAIVFLSLSLCVCVSLKTAEELCYLLCDNVRLTWKNHYVSGEILLAFFLFHTRIEIVLPMRLLLLLYVSIIYIYIINYRFHCYSFNCMIMLVSFSIRWSRFFFLFIIFVLNFETKEEKKTITCRFSLYIYLCSSFYFYMIWCNSCTNVLTFCLKFLLYSGTN